MDRNNQPRFFRKFFTSSSRFQVPSQQYPSSVSSPKPCFSLLPMSTRPINVLVYIFFPKRLLSIRIQTSVQALYEQWSTSHMECIISVLSTVRVKSLSYRTMKTIWIKAKWKLQLWPLKSRKGASIQFAPSPPPTTNCFDVPFLCSLCMWSSARWPRSSIDDCTAREPRTCSEKRYMMKQWNQRLFGWTTCVHLWNLGLTRGFDVPNCAQRLWSGAWIILMLPLLYSKPNKLRHPRKPIYSRCSGH